MEILGKERLYVPGEVVDKWPWGNATNHGCSRVILPVPPPLGGRSSAFGGCHLFSALGASLLPFFTVTTEKTKKQGGKCMSRGVREKQERKGVGERESGRKRDGGGGEGWHMRSYLEGPDFSEIICHSHQKM